MSEPTYQAQGSPMERMVSRLLAYTGESVVVEWEDYDDDWPTFRVLNVDIERHRVWLKGEDDEEGHTHKGDEFWVAVADIKRVRKRAANAEVRDGGPVASGITRDAIPPFSAPTGWPPSN